jgi:hypothetical protein
MNDLEQQFWLLMVQQQERSLTAEERRWCLDNFPENETLLEAAE